MSANVLSLSWLYLLGIYRQQRFMLQYYPTCRTTLSMGKRTMRRKM